MSCASRGLRRWVRVAPALLILVSLVFGIATVSAEAPANEHFQSVWDRTDRPVAEGMAVRTWMWGPDAFTGSLQEPYAESPGGQRTVQYYDKARMEITDPNGDPNSEWFATNGLLVVELITGQLQTGNATFEDRPAAQVNVAGDADNMTGPTYATLNSVLDQPPLAVGDAIVQRIGRDGTVTNEQGLAAQGITTAILDDVTQHTIATPFWDFMNSSGMVYEGGQYVQDVLFLNAYFATGRPITEPFWVTVTVGGTLKLVLLQCFERRCLTYTPDNAPEWRVEAGNVGRHYYEWRTTYDWSPDGPVTFGEGLYLIGDDIPAGTYRSSDPLTLCYWARLRAMNGETEDVITNNLARGRQVVTIAAGDVAFTSDDCGTWSSNLAPITAGPTAAFGDGVWIVGVDIAPGTWSNSDSSDGCYWARLDGFSRQLDDVLDNEFSYDPQSVVIQAGDTGFESSGCGDWTLIASATSDVPAKAPAEARIERATGS